MKKITKFTSLVLAFTLCITVFNCNTFKVKAATPTDTLYDGGVYRIRNVATGLYLTAYNGTDANGTNVVQQTLNTSSSAQKWLVSAGVNEGIYFYSMCSGNGYGRVLDIARGSANLANGQNVQLWDSNDTIAQSWGIYSGSTSMAAVFIPCHNDSIAMCAYGNSSGSTGTSSSSNGNVFMKTYDASDKYQQWYFEYIGQAPATPYMSISEINTKFPTSKYWNHGSSNNNANGYTSTPCASHSNCTYNGACGCNSYESSIQCLGFVKKLSYDIYHDSYLTGNWLKSYEQSFLSNVRSGDIIYRNGHAMMVQSVNTNNELITVLECNWDNKCGINRTRTINFDTQINWVARSPFSWY